MEVGIEKNGQHVENDSGEKTKENNNSFEETRQQEPKSEVIKLDRIGSRLRNYTDYYSDGSFINHKKIYEDAWIVTKFSSYKDKDNLEKKTYLVTPSEDRDEIYTEIHEDEKVYKEYQEYMLPEEEIKKLKETINRIIKREREIEKIEDPIERDLAICGIRSLGD